MSNVETRQVRRARARADKIRHGKAFDLKLADLQSMFDCVFAGAENIDGQVVAVASPAGRALISQVLPGTHTKWRKVEMLGEHAPDDWQEFTFVMADLLANVPDHKFPDRLLDLKPLEECSQDQLAFLWMTAVNDLGGRAALWSSETHRLESVHIKGQPQPTMH
jgi:hypothetical protein